MLYGNKGEKKLSGSSVRIQIAYPKKRKKTFGRSSNIEDQAYNLSKP